MRGVVRIEIHKLKKTLGWQARMYGSGQGRTVTTETRFFSDSHYGGKEDAYRAACEARQHMESGIAKTRETDNGGKNYLLQTGEE